MDVLSKDMIEQWIIPHVSKGARGPQPAVKLVDRVRAILPRLKTGTQCRFMPVSEFFEQETIKWGGVYHHQRQWIKEGSCMQLEGLQTQSTW
ncbi:MAG: hypothetical protein ICV51_17295, partial [Flavisolibacter sp.]|nr:hypothetical protein [Flavisolibacter sp.]